MSSDVSFTAAASSHEFEAFLFDMDGTIIDSTAAVVQHWHSIGKEIGIDGDGKFRSGRRAEHQLITNIVILQTSHGRRSIDVLNELKPELANWDCML